MAQIHGARSRVMRAAWQVARASAAKNGGSPREYLSDPTTLSIAWRRARMTPTDLSRRLSRDVSSHREVSHVRARIWRASGTGECRVYFRVGRTDVGCVVFWSGGSGVTVDVKSSKLRDFVTRWATAYCLSVVS